MIRLGRPSDVRCRVGVCFVRKKDGRLRLVVDARRANHFCHRPPRTELASTAAVIETMSHERDVSSGPNQPVDDLYFSSQDVSDCFYKFGIPESLQKMFALRNIRAKELGTTELDGRPVSGETFLTPFLTVLPMGFSWSLHFTQQAFRELLSRAGLGGIETEMTDKRPAPSFGLH